MQPQKKYRHVVSALVLKPTAVCLPGGRGPKDGKRGECNDVYQLLLVHKPRRSDVWQLPQGGVEEGETIEQAAMRELEEEVGLKLTKVKHVSDVTYCYDFPPPFIARYNPENIGQRLCFVMFLADKQAKIIVDKREVDNYAWVLPEQLPLYIQRKEYLEVVEKLLQEAREQLEEM